MGCKNSKVDPVHETAIRHIDRKDNVHQNKNSTDNLIHARQNNFHQDLNIDKPVRTNDHVRIEAADSEAFHTSFVQNRQQAIDHISYRSIIESWSPNSLQHLAETIRQYSKDKSFVARHWIIFYWIAHNIAYDTVSYFSKNYEDQSAEGVFRTRKGVCAGYANLYKYLCDYLQMPCEIVSGYAKGYGFDDRVEAPSETDHAWNAVEIDGHWYLMESTWGAGHLNNEKNFERKLNTYYFLPRPVEMIYHHLPEDNKWQLLQTPISMTQYMQMPKVHPVYFDLHLELVSPRNQAHVDLLDDKGYGLVLIRAPSHVALSAKLELNDQKVDGGHRVVFDNRKQLYYCYFAPATIGKHKITIFGKQRSGKDDMYDAAISLSLNVQKKILNPISFPQTWEKYFVLGLEIVSPRDTHIIKLLKGVDHATIEIKAPKQVRLTGHLENEQNEEIINGDHVYYDRQHDIWRCRFAPDRDGHFKATIYAKTESDSGDYTAVVSFKIEAKQIPSPPRTFPKTWQLFYDLDMQVESPREQGMIIMSRNISEVEILLRASENVALLGRLTNENKEEIENGQAVFYDQRTGLWRCKFAPDQVGRFTALILAKKKTDPGDYTSAISFQIEAKQIPSPPRTFPKTWQLFYDLGMQIESPRDQGTIVLSRNTSEVEILLRTPEDVALLGRLTNKNKEEIEGGQEVFYDQQLGLWRCKFAPDRVGRLIALIMAKKKSDPGSKYTSAISFQIEAKQIPSPPISYPHTWPLFYELGLKIEAPRNRANAVWSDNASYAEVLIQTPKDVQISCSIEYNNVKIENGSLTQFDQGKNLWQLLFAPEQTGRHELNVFAKRSGDNTAKFKSAVKFNLNVTKLQRPMKFPLIYTQFETKRCQIYTPLQGIIKSGAVVPIHCIVPGAKDVTVAVDSTLLKSDGYSEPVFKRNVTAGSKNVMIYAKYGPDSTYSTLVKYDVQ